MKYKSLRILLFLLLLTFGITNNCLSQFSYFDWVGERLPNLVLRTIDGDRISTDSLIGKSMVINFWSITCRPCIEEIPDLNRLKSEFNEVIFFAIAPESRTRIMEVLKKHAFNFIIIPDGSKAINTLRFKSFPVTIFVDTKGIIQHIEIGAPSIRNPDTGQLESFAYEHYRYSMPKISGKR